jgi:hypothetical protein
MPIRGYVKNGVAFMPEEVSAMSEAFEGAAETLGIGHDEMKSRSSLFSWPKRTGTFDAAALRDRAVAALGDPIRAASIPKDEKPDANQT